MSSTASVGAASADAPIGSGSTPGRTPYRLRRRICESAALVREPSSRATERISAHGTRLNSVTLSTGPREAIAMPGMNE